MKKLKHALLVWGAVVFAPACSAAVTSFGAGNISDAPNPAGYKCAIDHGYWIYNAGIVKPGVSSCSPIGSPTPIFPQKVAPATSKPTMTHRWWGSISFMGEMKVGAPTDAGYITPDPMTARITDRGVRILGIPGGLRTGPTSTQYSIPDPFNEVFDGIAIANSDYPNLEAYLKDYSDGSVTVQWNSAGTPVMEATFVHGSPYAYFTALKGNLQLRTKAADGGEKGVFYQQGNSLGVWTNVAGNHNNFLITGHDATTFSTPNGSTIGVNNTSKRMTVTLLPQVPGTPSTAMIQAFAQYATQRVDAVDITYAVNRSNSKVTVTHKYKFNNTAVTTMAGMLPMAWKNSNQAVTPYKVRSARGVTKFAATNSFSYTIPFVGVLPYLPENIGDYNEAQLKQFVTEFVSQGPAAWNDKLDTYWAGKNYGKVAELAAIARSIGMTAEADQLINWLKGELQDWFRANTNGGLDTTKYFSYDSNWNTLLGYDESFGSQQQLNDHHFHYGYFVRAAAEICRVDASWCSATQYGPMVDLLIRDYAAPRNDAMFPYLRNFDPAYGFSWASGHANFVLGNNNESTSEAANAYGAMVLYGQITNNRALTERGIYLHASSTAAYWEYWNNLDRFRGLGGDYDNFDSAYPKMTTSIIWGNGHVFSTWFSGAYAHILGIQGLPLSPLVFHVGQHADYLNQYVSLGMTESSNGKPSGLVNDQWRDVWWNIWAMSNGQAAADDMNNYGFNYIPEAGETKAHTYHWVHTLKELGHLATGTGALTASSPTAVAFNKNGLMTYIAYNYGCSPQYVLFSDGMTLNVPARSFRIKRTGETPDSLPTSTSCTPATSSSKSSLASSVTNSVTSSQASSIAVTTSSSSAVMTSSSTATSNAVASSSATSASSSSAANNNNYGHNINGSNVEFFANNAAWADIHFIVNGGGQQNIRMQHNADNSNSYVLSGVAAGATVKYFFTIAQEIGAMDTPWTEFVMGGATASSSAASSTPASSSSSSSSSAAAFSRFIEAETYAFMSGLELFPTADSGGGQVVGAIDAGDWMAFTNINFPTTGAYLVEYRVASPTGARLSLDLNGGSIVLGTADIPATGDWGNFTTVNQTVTVNAGTYNLGIYAPQSGWSINWLRITKL
ncbi:glycosyl hydrolase [Cellvibrio sp. UBA7661]|uniref:glycosyl hydrolase n=1 Tax=Cellvibrio sp. UBA7661 TaxID=1946311 RepID=UPI002F35E1AC